MSRLRGTQEVLPLDWLMLDARGLVGQHRGGALLARLLGAARRRQGITQALVAHRMGTSGATVSKLETGNQGKGRRPDGEPRLSTILRYAAAAEIEQSYVQLAFTVVLAAEFAGDSTLEQTRQNLLDVVSAIALTPA